jgi:EAL domain-containing protein (putative c-di-GMP-specific phosphodiesterase class I)
MINVIDEGHQWTLASVGLPVGLDSVDRLHSFCSDVIASERTLVVEDASVHPRYLENPYVSDAPGIGSYVGIPLIGRDALPIGTLAVIDWEPRTFSQEELEHLSVLAVDIMTALELRRVDRAMGRDPELLLRDALDPARILRGIQDGEFVDVFQPIVDLRTSEVRAFEALVRWNHPELGQMPPSLFLAAVERTGLMRVLGTSVLTAALDLRQQLERSVGRGATPVMSVNVAGTQLSHQGFAREVLDLLSERSLPAAALSIEVTESEPMHSDVALHELDELRRNGVGISLDDYGTGNATASHIVNLPLTQVKLDQSFTHSIDRNPRVRAVVESTLMLASQLDLEVCCEGVERETQRQALLESGASIGQGWLFSRPLDAKHTVAYLAGEVQEPQ